MALAPILQHATAVAVANRVAPSLVQTFNDKSFAEAKGAGATVELDVSLPIVTLAPSSYRVWDPLRAIFEQTTDTSCWHHQFRVGGHVDAHAISWLAPDQASDPIIVSITRRSQVAHAVDAAITVIDQQVPDDAYTARILKVPTHDVLAILLLNTATRHSYVFTVMAPTSFTLVRRGKRHDDGAQFLKDLNAERGGGGYKLAQVLPGGGAG